VVAAAVDACHGRLEIASGPGRGTTVRLTLPTGAVAS
jgi:chemotaxis protein histidine kinase CheA